MSFIDFLREQEKKKIEEVQKKKLKKFVVKFKDKIMDSFKSEFEAVQFITKKSPKPLDFSLSRKGGWEIVDSKKEKV